MRGNNKKCAEIVQDLYGTILAQYLGGELPRKDLHKLCAFFRQDLNLFNKTKLCPKDPPVPFLVRSPIP